MAILGKWSGGVIGTLIPTTSWAAPNAMFPTEDRNDSSTYTFTSSTSTVTLPSSGLADGYLIIGAYEFVSTANTRYNPQGRIVQASGTGNFVGGPTGGYLRDDDEASAYVRAWGFVDNPSASATFQFQWKSDTSSPNASDGPARSEFQIIPLFYAAHGLYSSTSADQYGGTTPNLVTGFAAVDESDTGAIEIASNVVTVKTDNKRYLVLGSIFFEGHNARTQRWGGLEIDGTFEDAAKSYSYWRENSTNETGDFYTWIIDRVTADITIETNVYRGDGVLSGEGGAADDGGSAPDLGDHTLVILELNSSAEIFRNTGSTNQNIATTGPVDIQASKVADLNLTDSASFERASDTGMNAVVAMDGLFGANISAASESAGSVRYTGYAEFTIDGVEDTDSVGGDYLRGNSAPATFGWSASLLGFQSLSQDEDIGISATELTTSDGGDGAVHIQVGWVGFWGLNLDTLEAVSGLVITGAAFENSSSFGSGEITTGAATITGSAFTNVSDIGAGAISAGPVTISGSAFTGISTFGSGTISQGLIVTGVLFENTSAFGSGEFAAGAVTITGASFSSISSFGSGAVSQGIIITGADFANVSVFGLGAFTTGAVTIEGESLTNANAFGSGLVIPGAVTISGSDFVNASVFGSGAITVGAVTISGAAFANTSIFGSGIFTGGVAGSVRRIASPAASANGGAASQSINGGTLSNSLNGGTIRAA